MTKQITVREAADVLYNQGVKFVPFSDGLTDDGGIWFKVVPNGDADGKDFMIEVKLEVNPRMEVWKGNIHTSMRQEDIRGLADWISSLNAEHEVR